MAPGFIALFLGGLAALFGGLASGGSSEPDTADRNASDPDPSGDLDSSDPGDPGTAALAGTPDLTGGDDTGGWTGPTPEEQLIVELINRARMDPASEVARLGEPLASGIPSDPAEPLAITPALSAAARAHSEDMDDRDFFAHSNPDGQSPGARALEEGHGSTFVGENIGWIGSSRLPSDTQARAEAHHANLWESDGHQRNLMNDRWSEIGVGYDEGDYRGLDGSTFVTEKFGDRGETYLTGVVIEDGDGDDFYDIGEGLGGVSVTASDGSASVVTETWGSGGYALALPGGTYQVSFSGGGLDAAVTRTVVIGGENVKLDVIEDSGVVTASFALEDAPPEASAELPYLPEVALADIPEDDEPADTAMDLLLA